MKGAVCVGCGHLGQGYGLGFSSRFRPLRLRVLRLVCVVSFLLQADRILNGHILTEVMGRSTTSRVSAQIRRVDN